MDARPRDLGNCVCGALQERVLQRDRELVSETRAGWRATALERLTGSLTPKLNPDVSGRRWLGWPSLAAMVSSPDPPVTSGDPLAAPVAVAAHENG
jgi:hypothetical protein